MPRWLKSSDWWRARRPITQDRPDRAHLDQFRRGLQVESATMARVDSSDVIGKCRSLAASTEGYPFGDGVLVFKVGGKIFAIVDDKSVSLKCDPGLAIALREQFPAVTAGYHLNKRHWNTVALDGSVPSDVISEWIEDSYDLALASLTRAQRAALT